MTKMNYSRCHAEDRYARGLREEESGSVIPYGDNRPPSKRSEYSYEEKKLIKEAQTLVAGYAGRDGNLIYFKSDGVNTPKRAAMVLRILNGTEYSNGKKKCVRQTQKPKPLTPNSSPTGSSRTIRSSGTPWRVNFVPPPQTNTPLRYDMCRYEPSEDINEEDQQILALFDQATTRT